MRIQIFAILTTLLPTSTFADCASNMSTLMSCTISGGEKRLDLCTDGAHVLYRYGGVGQTPDLELIRGVKDVGYTPWAGVGSSIWESISLSNGNHKYEVYSSIERNLENPEPTGGIEVQLHSKLLSSIKCDAGSVVANIDELFGLREDAGLCYDHASFEWKDCG